MKKIDVLTLEAITGVNGWPREIQSTALILELCAESAAHSSNLNRWESAGVRWFKK